LDGALNERMTEEQRRGRVNRGRCRTLRYVVINATSLLLLW